MVRTKPQDSEVNWSGKKMKRVRAPVLAREKEREGGMQWVNKSYVEQMAGAAIS